jgi:hypothetical protein
MGCEIAFHASIEDTCGPRSKKRGPQKVVAMQDSFLCSDCAKLQYDVMTALEKIAETVIAQLEAFRVDDWAGFAQLDGELEFAIGEKERRIVVLKQHRSEHRERAASAPRI